MALNDGLTHCKLALAFAIIMDLLGGTALLVGIFARLQIKGQDYGDLLVYSGTYVCLKKHPEVFQPLTCSWTARPQVLCSWWSPSPAGCCGTAGTSMAWPARRSSDTSAAQWTGWRTPSAGRCGHVEIATERACSAATAMSVSILPENWGHEHSYCFVTKVFYFLRLSDFK